MDGLDQRGYPRRSLWACFYAASSSVAGSA